MRLRGILAPFGFEDEKFPGNGCERTHVSLVGLVY